MSFRTCRKARGSVILGVREFGVGAVQAAIGVIDVGGAVEAVVVAWVMEREPLREILKPPVSDQDCRVVQTD